MTDRTPLPNRRQAVMIANDLAERAMVEGRDA